MDFKSSWKNYSVKQKAQLVGIFSLVLLVPALVSNNFVSAQSGIPVTPPITSPITPPVSPTPTPTPKPNSTPVISAWFMSIGTVLKPYRGIIYGYDTDNKDILTVSISGLPDGLSLGPCTKNYTSLKSIIDCSVVGIPTKSGIFNNVQLTIKDNKGGVAVSKSTLTILVPRSSSRI